VKPRGWIQIERVPTWSPGILQWPPWGCYKFLAQIFVLPWI
jgi:hypothetical protein